MKNKEFKHTDVSPDHTCRICNKPIKKRLIKIKPVAPTLCYNHWRERENARKFQKPNS